MRNFKFGLFFGLAIFLVLVPIDSKSQAIGRAINKGATKIVGKQATKAAVKSTAKTAVKTATKAATKTTTKGLRNETTEIIIKKGVKAISKKEAKAAVKQGAKKAVTTTSKKGASKAIRTTAKSVADNKLVRKFAQKELPQKMIQESLEEVGGVGMKKLSKEAAEEVSEQLTQKLGKETMAHWRKIVPDPTSGANQIFLKDLSENPKLSRIICGSNGKGSSPQLMEAYTRCLKAPSARTNPNVLRYLSNGADLYHNKGVYKKTIYGKGANLKLAEQDGLIHVFKDGSAKSIGEMKSNGLGGYDVKVPFEDRTLLNLYPMKNSTYTTTRQLGKHGYVKLTWFTDECGRTIKTRLEVKPEGKFIPIKRDKNSIQSIGRIKKDNTIHGQTPNRPTYINDDSGHMSALQCGGTNDNINLLSQNASLNKGLWKKGEDAARKSIDEGKSIIREVEIRYSDKVDLRPSSFNVNQFVGGEQTISNQSFENLIEVVK